MLWSDPGMDGGRSLPTKFSFRMDDSKLDSGPRAGPVGSGPVGSGPMGSGPMGSGRCWSSAAGFRVASGCGSGLTLSSWFVSAFSSLLLSSAFVWSGLSSVVSLLESYQIENTMIKIFDLQF